MCAIEFQYKKFFLSFLKFFSFINTLLPRLGFYKKKRNISYPLGYYHFRNLLQGIRIDINLRKGEKISKTLIIPYFSINFLPSNKGLKKIYSN
jgi:hypothetical protein